MLAGAAGIDIALAASLTADFIKDRSSSNTNVNKKLSFIIRLLTFYSLEKNVKILLRMCRRFLITIRMVGRFVLTGSSAMKELKTTIYQCVVSALRQNNVASF